jgi:hypothetical protein
LLFSVGPGVRKWFKKAALEVELYERISIGHYVGNPILFLTIIIRNVGGRDLRIRRLRLRIRKNDRELAVIPAMNFYDKLSADASPVVLMSVSLPVGETWSHMLQFFPPFDRDLADEVRTAANTLQADILAKRAALPPQAQHQLVAGEPANVERLVQIFDQLFVWTRGQYKVALEVDTEPGTHIDQRFEFTLFESDETAMRLQSQSYAVGDGLWWEQNAASRWLDIPITR